MHLAGGTGDSLLAGGYDGAGGYLASTELLVEGDSVWQEAGELPTARYGARAVTVNSRVILTGESLCGGRLCNIYTGGFTPFPGEYYASIHRFDPATLAWLEVGAMRQPRSFHGLSVVMAEDIRDYCR